MNTEILEVEEVKNPLDLNFLTDLIYLVSKSSRKCLYFEIDVNLGDENENFYIFKKQLYYNSVVRLEHLKSVSTLVNFLIKNSYCFAFVNAGKDRRFCEFIELVVQHPLFRENSSLVLISDSSFPWRHELDSLIYKQTLIYKTRP